MDVVRRITLVVVAVALLSGVACTQRGSTEAFCRRLAEPPPADRWGDADLILFVGPDATDRQIDALRGLLDRSADVAGYTWYDQDETYAEFVELFADTPEMVDAVSPEQMTQSARVRTTDSGPESARRVGDQLQDRPGTYRVVHQGDVPRSVIEASVRPLAGDPFWAGTSMFARGRADLRLAEIAPGPVREPAHLLERYWASPGALGETELEEVAEAARRIADFYDAECP
jgi:hypothetical protein